MAVPRIELLGSKGFTLVVGKRCNDDSANSVSAFNLSADIDNFSSEEEFSRTDVELEAVRVGKECSKGI